MTLFFKKKNAASEIANQQVLAEALLKTANAFQKIVVESGHDFKSEIFRDGISMYTEEEQRLSEGQPIKAHQCALLTAFHLVDMTYENRDVLLPNRNDHDSLLIAKSYLFHLVPSIGIASGAPPVDERQLNEIADQVYFAVTERCGNKDMADMIKTAVVANTIGATANNLTNR